VNGLLADSHAVSTDRENIEGAQDARSREAGSVKFFDPVKRYGFLTTARGDLFVHASGIADGGTLERGQSVMFRRGENRGRPVALDVAVSR
jgi:cold shock CspA family protein